MKRDQPPAEPTLTTPTTSGPSDVVERVAALQSDNKRLRELLAVAARLAEFGRFAAKQNHELRQPLFAIKGLAQLLLEREQVDQEEARDFARHIVEQAERLTGLVSDLRHLSLPTTRGAQRTSDVSAVLLRVAALLDWRFRKGVTLRTEIAPDLPGVGLGAHELEQILINLMSNALDAVAGQPARLVQVRVTLAPESADGTAIQILVADSGTGIPRAVRGRLFESFFTTKGEEEGTGLGLAVSRELARAAGGDLDLADTGSEWTERPSTIFRLRLPIAGASGPT